MKFFKSLLNIIDSPVVVPFLLCFGVIFRLVLSLVLFKASHHDEWFQVFDLPNLMVFGESRDMGEVHFHLRNLSLYWLCTLPIIALDALGFDAPYYRISFVRGSVAVLDMCIPLSAWRTAIKLDPKLNRKWQVAIVVFFSFIWFRLRVAPATSLEHFSEIAMWLTFACSVLAKRKSFVWYGWTGFFLVLIGLFRYPSGAFSLGFAMALVGTLARRKEWRSIVALSFGLVVALIGGGVADYVYYGRPYESLWMYLQYNVWSGLAGETFGRASTWVYAQHFINRLGGGLTIISVIFGYFGLKYFWKRMREIDPLCFGLVFFMVAHFIPSHKEARFMEPMLSFFLWFGLLGLNDVWPEIKKFLSQKPIGLAKGIVFVAVLSFLVNGVHVLVLMRGDYGKPFFNAIIAHSFPEDKNDCMIVSDRMIPWSFFQINSGIGSGGERVWSYLESSSNHVFSKRDLRNLIHSDDWSFCVRNVDVPTFLVSFDHLDSSMEGCSDANFQNVYFQVSKQISGVTGLWRCPFKLIEDVPSSLAKTYPLYRGSRFPKLTKLPPYGLNGEQLKDFVKRHSIRRGAERL